MEKRKGKDPGLMPWRAVQISLLDYIVRSIFIILLILIRQLLVGNLPVTVTHDDLKALVSKLCPVVEVHLPPLSITGNSSGY
jgi:hypothetical protein